MARTRHSRRSQLAALRQELLTKGATIRHVACMIAVQQKVNPRVAFRYAHGLTQQQVAKRWNDLWPSSDGERPITHKHISYWETWPAATGRAPSADVLNRLARIYECRASDLLDGEDYSHPAPTGTEPTTLQFEVPSANTTRIEPTDVISRVERFIPRSNHLGRESDYEHLMNELIEWACRMRRRDILQWLSWAAAAAAAAPVLDGLDSDERERALYAFSSRHHVDAAVVDHIEAVLWRCMRQDDALGPQAALDTVLAQRTLVRRLLPAARPALRDQLLSLYANLSRFAGWLSFDLNHYSAALDYYETARAAAHEAHDTKLGAFVLCNMSHLATWRGQARVGIDHAVAAQGWANQTEDARLRAYAADVAARAYAMDGQERFAWAAVNHARTELAKANGDLASESHVYFYNTGQLASTESVCYLHLGQPDRGAVVAEAALSQIDDTFVRNLALTSLRLGMCRLSRPQPDVESAVAAIRNASRLASHNRSARLVERLQRCWRELSPWQHTRAVREVRDELAAYRVVA